MKIDFKQIVLPHLIAIGVFLVMASIFSGPAFQGQRIITHDYSVFQSVSNEKNTYEDKLGRTVLWTNSMFGGMPTYLITTPKEKNIFDKIYHALLFGGFIPFNYIFWYFTGFYILLLVFKVDPRVAMFGSLAFGLSSYSYIIITAGHFTKAVSIGFMAPVIGGIYLAYKRNKPLAGALLMTFFLVLQIVANHMQVVYYTFMIAFVFGIIELIYAIKEKYLQRFIKTTVFLVIGAFLALGINAAHFLTTYEYLPYSQRGPSELSSAQYDRTTGLDRSYATQWSYGLDETFTLLIPNVKGGASGGQFSTNSETYKAIERVFGPQTAKEVVETMPMPTYFGDQPFTSGPVYFGAFVVFLFIFALLIVKGRIKWWLLIVTILSILLSWGKNFMWFTDLFFDYFPYYNRFRVVAMTLLIAQFTFPLLASLGLWQLINNNFDKEKVLNKFYIALGTTALITMIFIAVPSIAGLEGASKSEDRMAKDFASHIPAEHGQMRAQFERDFVESIHADRASLVRSDAFRSLAFIILGAAFLYLFIIGKIKSHIAVIAMAGVVVIDMAVINKRYLSDDDFSARRHFERPYLPTVADNYILNDSDISFRVLNLAVRGGAFNDGRTSMFHKSVGGYSAVKIRRYQELYDSVMWKEFADYRTLINSGFQNGLDMQQVQELVDVRTNTPVLNMLNTKYVIFHDEMNPIINNNRFGNAWFVNNHIVAENADEEIAYMMRAGRGEKGSPNYLDLRNTAVVNKVYENYLSNLQHVNDDNASIKLVNYAPDHLIFESKSEADRLAVFSEIYYPKGWKVFIDGEEHDHFRVNYVLRAMVVPKGNHTIEFKFEPESYRTGVIISYLSSAILLLLIFGYLFMTYRKSKEN